MFYIEIKVFVPKQSNAVWGFELRGKKEETERETGNILQHSVELLFSCLLEVKGKEWERDKEQKKGEEGERGK